MLAYKHFLVNIIILQHSIPQENFMNFDEKYIINRDLDTHHKRTNLTVFWNKNLWKHIKRMNNNELTISCF